MSFAATARSRRWRKPRLTSPAAPIVLLEADGKQKLPDSIAPGLRTLGFMLPTTPLHALMLRRMSRPVVMTSGNISNSPQVISDEEAQVRLGTIATYALVHDRDIVNRVDDFVVRVTAETSRLSAAPAAMRPHRCACLRASRVTPEILALGGDLKSAFCLAKAGTAVLSQHIGDLDDAETLSDFGKSIELYKQMQAISPSVVVSDMHPGYHSRGVAKKLGASCGAKMIEVQHHHAHVASCLAENGRALDAAPVLGIALDGLGYGMTARSGAGNSCSPIIATSSARNVQARCHARRGSSLARALAQSLCPLMAEMGWANFAMNFSDLDVFPALEREAAQNPGCHVARWRQCADGVFVRAPFDAAAAAMGLCFERKAMKAKRRHSLKHSPIEDTLQNGDGPRLSLHHSASQGLEPALYRAACRLECHSRRSHLEYAAWHDGGALPPRPWHAPSVPWQSSLRAATARRARASIRSRSPAAVSTIAFCLNRSLRGFRPKVSRS